MMTKQDLTLVHNILEPQEYSEKPPLLLMLHGYGSHENDLFSMAPMLNKKCMVVSARAPIALSFGGFAWYNINFEALGTSRMSDIDQAKASLEKIRQFKDEAVEVYGADPDRVWLMGFSQGCILSYALALNYPKQFSKVLALSGYILKEIVPEKYKLEDYIHLDFFVSHGSMDEVLPVEWGRQATKVLEQLKISYQYREYPMGHGVNPDCFEDIKSWMKERGML